MTRYPTFDRTQIELAELAQRGHDLRIEDCLPLSPPPSPYRGPGWDDLIARIVAARRAGRPLIALMGAHPIKLGLSAFLVDLIQRRIITHLGTNGAGLIHDFELAAYGGTSEDVARWIRVGQFGLWRETSVLNEIAVEAAARDEGLGEAIGRVIEERGLPHRRLSLAAAGWRSGVPVTSHVAIGCDITHAHPNCDGAALGKSSYTDFLIFARAVQELEGGVFLNIGTSTIGPEVYLKAHLHGPQRGPAPGPAAFSFHHGRLRPAGPARRLVRRSAGEVPAALLLSSLEDDSRADGRRRRRQPLLLRRPPPDHPHALVPLDRGAASL